MSWAIRIYADADYEQFKLFRDYIFSRFSDLILIETHLAGKPHSDWYIHLCPEEYLGFCLDYYKGDHSDYWNNRFNQLSMETRGSNEFISLLHVIIPVLAFKYFPKIFIYEDQYGKIFKTSLSYENFILNKIYSWNKNKHLSTIFIELADIIKSTDQSLRLYDFIASRQLVTPKNWWEKLFNP